MTFDNRTEIDLPSWVLDAIDGGETLDDFLNKRSEPRRLTYLACDAQDVDDPSPKPFTVRVANVSTQGMGFIAHRELPGGIWLRVKPSDDANARAVIVRVVHCTRAIQGYKVGCLFLEVESGPKSDEATGPAADAADGADQSLAGKQAMTLRDWLAASNPPGIWVDLGSREAPDRFPGFPGMRYDRDADIWWLPAQDGTYVPALMRPHPLISDLEDRRS